ncbi:MAG: histidinol-phosphate transaminase [Bacteroidetes bacterium]|nr:histidinol-phosphate transaminase [Bacteroidota bacterium]
MKFNLDNLTRENIKKLTPYSSARNEYKGKSGIFLDANENSNNDLLYNRYPDPLQIKLKQKIASLKKLTPENILIGNGSDEAIDLLFRAFCEPVKDNVIICPPTYGMYEVIANINNINVIYVPLTPDDFQLDVKTILGSILNSTKLILLCCPNNPTGNGVKWNDIQTLLIKFKGIVVVDEAYIDFASYKSLISELKNYPNLVILQTLSKAWGLAALRLGLAIASPEIISVFNKIKSPYNISSLSQTLALKVLNDPKKIIKEIKKLTAARKKLSLAFLDFSFITKVYPSEANFVLVKTTNANKLYNYLAKNKIIIRNRSNIAMCEDCLRITVGTKEENKLLLTALNNYKS